MKAAQVFLTILLVASVAQAYRFDHNQKLARLVESRLSNPIVDFVYNHPEIVATINEMKQERDGFSSLDDADLANLPKNCQTALKNFVAEPTCKSFFEDTDNSAEELSNTVGMVCTKTCLSNLFKVLEDCKTAFKLTDDQVKATEKELTKASKMLCVTDPTSGALCINILAPNGVFPVDFDDETTMTNANMDKICVPCFHIFFDSVISYSSVDYINGQPVEATGDANAMIAATCLKDPLLDRYCLPYISETPDSCADDDMACQTALATYVCTSTCHARFLSLDFHFDSSLSAQEKTNIQSELNFMCLKRPGSNEYCTAAWADQNNDFDNVACTNPGSDICSTCSGAIDDMFSTLGCCFQSGYQTFSNIVTDLNELADMNGFYAAVSVCDPTNAALTACPAHGGSITTGAISVTLNIDCDYYNSDKAGATAALLQDFAISNGVLPADVSAFSVTCVNSRKKGGSLHMSGTTQGNDDARTTTMQQTAAHFSSDDYFTGSYSTKSAKYNKQHSNSVNLVAPSFLLVVITVFVATLF